MEAASGEFGAFGEAVVFLDYFKELPDLRQRGKQLGRDRAGGIRVEQRFVPPPRFDRILVERPTDEKEQFARLADNVIDEVCQRECREDERREANDPNRPRCCGQGPSQQARASPAADAAEQGVPALPDARLARAGLGSARRGHADVWPVVRRHATAGRRGVIGSDLQSGSAPDDVAPRHGHRWRDDRQLHSLRERCQAQPAGVAWVVKCGGSRFRVAR